VQEWDAGSLDIRNCESLYLVTSHFPFVWGIRAIRLCLNVISDLLMSHDTSSVIQPKHVVGAYQVVNAFCFLFNCYGKILPAMGHAALWTSLISFFIILIAVPAKAETHQNARFVFATFYNNTGWTSNGIGTSSPFFSASHCTLYFKYPFTYQKCKKAFIVGLINANYSFACLDCATHLAEEVPNPARTIPIAILGTVFIGFLTAWPFSIAIFFSIADLKTLLGTSTLVPILELVHQALSSTAGAIVLEALIMATGVGCLVSSHTWQSRLCWSFARDRGVPFGSYLGHVNKQLDVPLRAHVLSCAIVAALGCLYLGSYTAFNRYVLSSALHITTGNPVTSYARYSLSPRDIVWSQHASSSSTSPTPSPSPASSSAAATAYRTAFSGSASSGSLRISSCCYGRCSRWSCIASLS